MQTSDKGIAFLASHEGIVPAPYRDSVGVWTYGVGHTKSAGDPDPEDMPRAMPVNLDAEVRQALRVFKRDLAKYEAGVRRAIRVDVTQSQFDAAVSFHFNTGAIARASWVKHLNAGDTKAAAKAIMNWTKPPEIKPRRKAEQRLFANGDYGKTSATIWGTNGEGRIIWRPIKTLDQSTLTRLMGRDPKPAAAPAQPKPTGLFALLMRIFGKG